MVLNEKLSRSELGGVAAYPLLRVHFRSQDRPKLLLDVLDSLMATLTSELPSIAPDNWSIPYARAQITAGHAMQASLTVCIPIPSEMLDSWTPDKFERMERMVRSLAGLDVEFAHFPSSLGDELNVLEDSVISIGLIRTPAEQAYFEPVSSGTGHDETEGTLGP